MDTKDGLQKGVTEVHVTRVSPDKIAVYQEWLKKIHQVESTFPGFQKVYEQQPTEENGSWITLVRFDSAKNLERWRSSPERAALMQEVKDFIQAQESHQLHSSFDGWFAKDSPDVPPLWKQTMLVLLVLFPIVMLQYKYLSPLTSGLNLSLATFIGNAISVSLISWPLMPIALYLLGWWLVPKPKTLVQILGVACLLTLYVVEIFIFWN